MENKEITLADYVVDRLANEVKELKIQLAKAEFSAMMYKEKHENLLNETKEQNQSETNQSESE